jgi:hypothetical protein
VTIPLKQQCLMRSDSQSKASSRRKDIITMRASPSRIGHIWLIANVILEDLFDLTIGNIFNRFALAPRIKKPGSGIACGVTFPETSRPELKIRFRITN